LDGISIVVTVQESSDSGSCEIPFSYIRFDLRNLGVVHDSQAFIGLVSLRLTFHLELVLLRWFFLLRWSVLTFFLLFRLLFLVEKRELIRPDALALLTYGLTVSYQNVFILDICFQLAICVFWCIRRLLTR